MRFGDASFDILARTSASYAAARAPTAMWLRRGSSRDCSSWCRGRSADPIPGLNRGTGVRLCAGSRRAGGAAVAASASGAKVPTSANNKRNLAVRRCMFCGESEPRGGVSIEQNRERAQVRGGGFEIAPKPPTSRAKDAREMGHPGWSIGGTEGELKMDCGMLSQRQALPLILAHHQRTPTKRNRQSLKNSGGLPSKAWPMNWRIHPRTNSAERVVARGDGRRIQRRRLRPKQE